MSKTECLEQSELLAARFLCKYKLTSLLETSATFNVRIQHRNSAYDRK